MWIGGLAVVTITLSSEAGVTGIADGTATELISSCCPLYFPRLLTTRDSVVSIEVTVAVGMSREMFVMEIVGDCVVGIVDFKVEVTTVSVGSAEVVVDGLSIEVATVTGVVEGNVFSTLSIRKTTISTHDCCWVPI